jgi:CxxC motif-containing protein
MPKENFNPSDSQYKKVKDLPEEHKEEFIDISEDEGTGFIRKEAYYNDFKNEKNIPKKFFFGDEIMKDPIAIKRAMMTLLHMEAIYVDSFQNKNKILAVIEEGLGFTVLEDASDALRADKEVVLAAVKKYPRDLEYASDALRADKEVVMAALKKGDGVYNLLEYVPEALRADKEVALTALKNGDNIKYVPENLRADEEIVLAALNGGAFIGDVPEKFRTNKEYIIIAVARGRQNFESLPKNFRADKEVVMAAVKNNGKLLKYASSELRADKEIVLAAIKSDMSAKILGYAAENLRSDREVVLTAVRLYGDALEYASDELRADKEIVLEALKRRPDETNDMYIHFKNVALKYASPDLQNNLEFLCTALEINPSAEKYIPEDIRKKVYAVLSEERKRKNEEEYALWLANREKERE